jgi:TrpR-related protein YerC/YecD
MKDRDFTFGAESNKLFEAMISMKSMKECENFFRDLMTLSELQAVTERYQVARMLHKGDKSYRQINEETGVSTATITRIKHWMGNGMGGYKIALERNEK